MKKKSRWIKNNFARNVLTLITGTGTAQLLAIAIMPLLTRIYSPEEFGTYSLYVAICSILAIVFTGKYELAIIVPKRDGDAINLLALSVFLCAICAAISTILILVFEEDIINIVGESSARQWIKLIPLTTLLIGVYQSLNYWINRRSNYSRMALSRIMQSGTNGGSQLIMGISKLGGLGLVLGQILGQLISTVYLATYVIKEEKLQLKKIRIKAMHSVAKKYINYPRFMIIGQLFNVGSTQLPLLLLGSFFGPAVTGHYSLAQNVMLAPTALVANAIGDVYRKQAAETYALHGMCKNLFLSTFKKLVIFSLLPTIPVLILGPYAFMFIFGEAWREAGEIASILSVMVLFQTISSPLSLTVLFPNWHKLDFIWQFLRLALSFLSFYLGYIYFNSYKAAIILHVFFFSILYLVHSYIQYKAARGDK